MLGLTLVDKVSASDPKSALALQRLVQAVVWFLGKNANYAAPGYAWESSTPPSTALMMLDANKMVAAANSRNPILVGALTRLQRCAFIKSISSVPIGHDFPPLSPMVVLHIQGESREGGAEVEQYVSVAGTDGLPASINLLLNLEQF
ncbi:hypothetical protein KIW84_042568 [Lathyrus oleraceus]|uniref:Uncharacterized protein n=1 Tax=Pisum sativum TaxID=3888 RepID=A0A9D5AQP3_PEA|nr:hypothetical protein KIW84_042568 [Pisum sativum]